MRVLAVVVTMLLTGCSSHLPTNTQILSVDWLKDIVQPCSRQGPGLVTNGWKVTPQIAMQIEQALPDIADRMRGEDPRSHRSCQCVCNTHSNAARGLARRFREDFRGIAFRHMDRPEPTPRGRRSGRIGCHRLLLFGLSTMLRPPTWRTVQSGR